ncbi:MAG TPA: molybdenum cofactor biosynthesis protein MoaE [Solirubrobacteraceae bacterium]|nr:molybdenum cofactor biosynthesis protein MoaE [Solirubrobacteraceae bacterium]
MRVTVRLFAGLRERAGAGEVTLDLPDGARVSDALQAVAEITAGTRVVMAVNREYADERQRLAPGDELALIPPVSGGAGPNQPPGNAESQGPSGGAESQGPSGGAEPSGLRDAAPSGSAGRRDAIHARVSAEPLALDPLLAFVRDARAGAVITFAGVTREVPALEYEAYAEMAVPQMRAILERALTRHGLCAAAAEHRTGTVTLSEPSVLIAVSAPHRAEAFAGGREIIDELKRRAPIWKREEGEWVSGTAPTVPPRAGRTSPRADQ